MSFDETEDQAPRPFNLGTWRTLFGYTRPYRKEVILLSTAAVVLAALETALPLLIRRVVDDLSDPERPVQLTLYAVWFAAISCSFASIVWGFIILCGRVRVGVSHDIRRDAFNHVQSLSFSYFDQRPVGWIVSRITSDCERLSNIMAWGVLDIVWGATLTSGVAVTMLWLEPTLALWVLAVVPVLAFVSWRFQRRILDSSRHVRRANSRLTASYNESVMGVRTTRVFGRERKSLRAFRGLSAEMREGSVRNALLSALYLPVVLVLGAAAFALALQRGGLDVASGAITLGTLIAFLAFAEKFFEPIQQMAHWFAEMQMAQASAERVLSLIAEPPEIEDSEEVKARVKATRNAGPGMAADGLPDRVGTIRFDHVSFSYVAGEPVLHDFDLEVPPGQFVALVGPTGGGKSTLVNLLCRFYEPTEGSIRLDGHDLRERPLRWLRSQFGIVLQTPQLFRGTIRENIRYGRLEASDSEVEQAARTAGLDEVMDALPLGFDTEVGESGQSLSVGQRQLVSLARAILADPPILVMDEATSSVDTETEQRIQHAMKQALAGRTSFVIAHRLSTIREADRILVIEKGRLIESGTHDELVALGGRYHRLDAQQRLQTRKWTESASPPVQ